MRGFCLKQGKENLVGGRGTPLNIKSNLKDNSGLIRVFEIHRINYCFLVLSKTGIFFLQPWRSRRSNIVWRGHILLSFSNGKPQSGHTFGRPTNSQLENMFKFPYLALTRLNSALSRTNSPNLATAKWTPILISHPTLRVISQLLHKGQHHTVKPRFNDNFFRKICMKRVFGFQQKGTLLFLFTSMAEVKSVENKQLYKTRI